MSLKILNGDLLKSDVPAIAHQCNCFNILGGGFAAAIRAKWPRVYEADMTTIRGSKEKLGGYSVAVADGKRIYNVYSQFDVGQNATCYQFLERGLKSVLTDMHTRNINRLGLPYLIGCGLAGGDPSIVLNILNGLSERFPDIDIELYQL